VSASYYLQYLLCLEYEDGMINCGEFEGLLRKRVHLVCRNYSSVWLERGLDKRNILLRIISSPIPGGVKPCKCKK
jgi:hypothetical protein